MTDPMVDRVPRAGAVWNEQLRVVGLAIRREGALAGAALLLGSLVFVAVMRIPVLTRLVEGDVGELFIDPGEPPWAFFAVLTALLLPLVVWKGERRFGDTPLWSLPVDHRRHALTKVAAGWVWLMAVLGSALVLVVVTVLAAGGSLGADEVRVLIVDLAAAPGTPGATDMVDWTTPWWEWVLPFTAATAAYLLASALMLATARPLFWALGIWAMGMAVMVPADIWDIEWIFWVADRIGWFAGADTYTQGVELPTGRREGWRMLPSLGMWATSSAFWIGLGVTGVLGGAARPRNQ